MTQSPGASAVPEKRARVLVGQSESAGEVLPKYWANSNAVPQRTAAPQISGVARLPSRFSMQESRLTTGAGLCMAWRRDPREVCPGHAQLVCKYGRSFT